MSFKLKNMNFMVRFLITFIFLGCYFSSSFANNEKAPEGNNSKLLQKILADGVIKIGVKTDVPPYNSINESGEIVGLESDIAAKIAEKIGVKLLKVGVTTENRFQKLELGDVDMLIATIGDTPARRQIATGIEPGYSETGVTVMFKPDAPNIADWASLRGQTLCAVQGAYFNRPMSERYLLKLETFKNVRDAQLALAGGRCAGFLYTAGAILQTIKVKPDFKDYKASLPTALKEPWAIYIPRAEKNTKLDHIVGDLIAEWHRNGYLLELNKKWDVTLSNQWLKDRQIEWSQKNDRGQYVCSRNENGFWPAECRRADVVNSSESSGLVAFGIWIKEQTGLDFNFIYDEYSRFQFFQGLGYSMILIALSIIMSLIVGIAAAVFVDNVSAKMSNVIKAIMSLGRLNPPLLLMYLLFFGVGGWALNNYGIQLSALLVAVIVLGYYTSGLILNAILEAATHIRKINPDFRLNYSNIYKTIAYSSWPIKQALINLTKQSMIASAIAIPELLSATNLLMAEKGNMFLMMTVLLICFFFITGFWADLFTWLLRKFNESQAAKHG